MMFDSIKRKKKKKIRWVFSWQVEEPDDWLRYPMPWEVIENNNQYHQMNSIRKIGSTNTNRNSCSFLWKSHLE